LISGQQLHILQVTCV